MGNEMVNGEGINMKLPDWWPYDKPYAIMDCLEGMKSLPDNCIDLTVTSPPYNLGIDYGSSYDDKKPYEEYLAWLETVFKELYRITKPDGRIGINHYLCYGTSARRFFPIPDISTILKNIGFREHAIVVWPDNTISKRTAWGSWKSASAPYINTPYEGIIIMFKEEWKKRNSGISTISSDKFKELVSGIWKMNPEKNREHPAPFPIELPKNAIELLTYKGDVVFDPFLGSGTTLRACRETDRIGLGFEINPDYEPIIKKRSLNEISFIDKWEG